MIYSEDDVKTSKTYLLFIVIYFIYLLFIYYLYVKCLVK